jgi:glycosyltransferase involved in cell wall biosynthesis
MRKKRILMCNETSLNHSGYSIYGYELLSRLHKTGKYEIAELAAWGRENDGGKQNLPWKYYPVVPNDKAEQEKVRSSPSLMFGEYNFNQVCLDFKPDIVFDIRDYWMTTFEEKSPARQYFKWVVLAPVDSIPQKPDWIKTYTNADAVLTYTEWGRQELIKQSNGNINAVAAAPYGIDFNKFQVWDKKELRKSIGFDEDINIVGTVMRNQARKLYPDLIKDFRLFLDKAPAEIAKKTFLYLHCAYPDHGWHIPNLLNEFGISHKTFFTYNCLNCRQVYPSKFNNGTTYCKFCGQKKATMPHPGTAIQTSELNQIFSLFDIYVQYANAEGLGLSQMEAAGSGTPIMSVDYSAMSEVVRNLKGYPIKVAKMFRELSLEAWRALPDSDDFVNKLIDFLSKPYEKRVEEGLIARKATEEIYNWETITATWEKVFDQQIPLDKWRESAKLPLEMKTPPEGLNDLDYVNWLNINVLNRRDFINNHITVELATALQNGYVTDGNNRPEFKRENVLGYFNQQCELYNKFEEQRIISNESTKRLY